MSTLRPEGPISVGSSAHKKASQPSYGDRDTSNTGSTAGPPAVTSGTASGGLTTTTQVDVFAYQVPDSDNES